MSVGRVRSEGVAIGMLEHLLIAAHLLVPGQVSPGSKLASVGAAEGMTRVGLSVVCDIR